MQKISTASAVSDKVENCDYMFSGCSELIDTQQEILPKSVKTCIKMFKNYKKLTKFIGVENAISYDMYQGADALIWEVLK